jgi:hypothetical protein
MTNPKNTRNDKTNLPCEWVDEERFDVTPIHGPALPASASDTSFLLKAKVPQRPIRSPNP